jgi:hypothetical protein
VIDPRVASCDRAGEFGQADRKAGVKQAGVTRAATVVDEAHDRRDRQASQPARRRSLQDQSPAARPSGAVASHKTG